MQKIYILFFLAVNPMLHAADEGFFDADPYMKHREQPKFVGELTDIKFDGAGAYRRINVLAQEIACNVFNAVPVEDTIAALSDAGDVQQGVLRLLKSFKKIRGFLWDVDHYEIDNKLTQLCRQTRFTLWDNVMKALVLLDDVWLLRGEAVLAFAHAGNAEQMKRLLSMAICSNHKSRSMRIAQMLEHCFLHALNTQIYSLVFCCPSCTNSACSLLSMDDYRFHQTPFEYYVNEKIKAASTGSDLENLSTVCAKLSDPEFETLVERLNQSCAFKRALWNYLATVDEKHDPLAACQDPRIRTLYAIALEMKKRFKSWTEHPGNVMNPRMYYDATKLSDMYRILLDAIKNNAVMSQDCKVNILLEMFRAAHLNDERGHYFINNSVHLALLSELAKFGVKPHIKLTDDEADTRTLFSAYILMTRMRNTPACGILGNPILGLGSLLSDQEFDEQLMLMQQTTAFRDWFKVNGYREGFRGWFGDEQKYAIGQAVARDKALAEKLMVAGERALTLNKSLLELLLANLHEELYDTPVLPICSSSDQMQKW